VLGFNASYLRQIHTNHSRWGIFKPFGAKAYLISMGEAQVVSWEARSAPHDEDAERVEQARQGDQLAFEQLYRRHRDRIYALMWRLCGGDHALAEDLLQESFVRAWNKLDSFRGDALFATWLHRLSANVALSDRRSRMRRVTHETALEGSVERKVSGEQDVRAGRRMDLERAIARLPERARTVLVLYDIEGYSHAEIAETAGMAIGSSKAQLHRARKLVREELEK
jgi:RNA polymerase sigma-70 factor (ECF subfamily)